MAWLSTYTATNRIELGSKLLEGSLFFGAPTGQRWRRLVTETRYAYTCMNEADAVTARDALQSASTWDNVIVAVVERQGDAGAYQVSVCETSQGAWEQET